MVTINDIVTGKFSINGVPFINISVLPVATMQSLKFSLGGYPWYGYGSITTVVVTGNIKAILKVPTPHINRFLGVDIK